MLSVRRPTQCRTLCTAGAAFSLSSPWLLTEHDSPWLLTKHDSPWLLTEHDLQQQCQNVLSFAYTSKLLSEALMPRELLHNVILQ